MAYKRRNRAIERAIKERERKSRLNYLVADVNSMTKLIQSIDHGVVGRQRVYGIPTPSLSKEELKEALDEFFNEEQLVIGVRPHTISVDEFMDASLFGVDLGKEGADRTVINGKIVNSREEHKDIHDSLAYGLQGIRRIPTKPEITTNSVKDQINSLVQGK